MRTVHGLRTSKRKKVRNTINFPFFKTDFLENEIYEKIVFCFWFIYSRAIIPVYDWVRFLLDIIIII